MVCQIVFGVLASIIVAWFSRYREFRADAGAASYMGQPNSMISALASLGRVEPGELPKTIQASQGQSRVRADPSRTRTIGNREAFLTRQPLIHLRG